MDNHKVYLSVNGQAHQNDIDIIRKTLVRHGFEVVTYTTDDAKITDCMFMVVLPSPLTYNDSKFMWIVGKGQYSELEEAENEDIPIYVKNIKTGLYQGYSDVFKINKIKDNDWINYAAIEVCTEYSLYSNDLVEDNYAKDEYYVDLDSIVYLNGHGPRTPDKIIIAERPAANDHPLAGVSVLGRPGRKRFINQ